MFNLNRWAPALVSFAVLFLFAVQTATINIEKPFDTTLSRSADDTISHQISALREGRITLSSQPREIIHDTAWVDGVQMSFGLGAAILRLPIEVVTEAVFKYPLPEKWIFFFYVILVFFYGQRVLVRRLDLPGWYTALLQGSFLLMPSFVNLGSVRWASYEEVCIYLLLASYATTLVFIDLGPKPSKFRLLTLGVCCGFLVVFRPTGLFIGFGLLCAALISEVNQRRWRAAWIAVIGFAPGILAQLFINSTRFGKLSEFGHALVASGAVINDYQLKFFNPFSEVSLSAAALELIDSLFFSPYFTNFVNYARASEWQAPVIRFREYYFPTFGLVDLLFVVFGITILMTARRWRPELRPLAGAAGLSFTFLFLFYLRTPGLTSRYISDFALCFWPFLLIILIASYDCCARWFRSPKTRTTAAFFTACLLASGSGVDLLVHNLDEDVLQTSQAYAFRLAPDLKNPVDEAFRDELLTYWRGDYRCHDRPEKFFDEVVYNGGGWNYKTCLTRQTVTLYFHYPRCLDLTMNASAIPWLNQFQPRVKFGLIEATLTQREDSAEKTRWRYCRPDPFPWKIESGPVFIGFADPQRLRKVPAVELWAVTALESPDVPGTQVSRPEAYTLRARTSR